MNIKSTDRTAVRRYFATAVIGTLTIVVCGAGVATAANGGSLVLGHKNTATKTTTLTDKHGTPLALIGKASKPPLTVNSSKQVAHLNASLLGGHSAAQLAPHAYVGQFNDPVSSGVALSLDFDHPTQLVTTGLLPAGSYLVTATASTDSSNYSVYCAINSHQALTDGLANSAGPAPLQTSTENMTAVLTLSAPTTLGLYCATDGSATAATANTASIVALPLLTVSHGTAATP